MEPAAIRVITTQVVSQVTSAPSRHTAQHVTCIVDPAGKAAAAECCSKVGQRALIPQECMRVFSPHDLASRIDADRCDIVEHATDVRTRRGHLCHRATIPHYNL